jgi:diguanylate cyclase (GGDEF)-like protein
MTVAQLQLLLAGALGANVLLLLVLVLPSLLARRLPGGDDPDLLVPPDLGEIALQVAAAQGDGPADVGGVSRRTSEAAVRLVSYGFLVTAAIAVAISGAWPATATAIYVLLGVAFLAVAVVHDLLPARILGPGKFILEGTGTVAVVTLLVALTGGAASPFVVGYFLIAAGAALLVDARTNFLLAASISILYLVTVFLVQAAQPLATMDVARLVAGLVAFWLISYLASVVARAQRTTRDAAVRLSLIDPLTRLANRAYVMAVLDREVQRAHRTGRGFCVLAADLDGLKPVNDTFGHPMGDRILRTVGEVIGSRIRGIDTAGRVGGDEFMILLPETEEAGAVILAEQLREGVNEIRVDAGTWVVRTSISVGVASFPADGDTADELLEAADAAMYASKRGGRDRVRLARGGRPMPLAHLPPVAVTASAPAGDAPPTAAPAPSAPPAWSAPTPPVGPIPSLAPTPAPAVAPAARIRPAGGAWQIPTPALGPAFGGRRADTVAAGLAWPRRPFVPAAETVGHATRAMARVTAPSLAGPGPGERIARPRPPERERPARAAEHAAAAPRPAARAERPAGTGEPRRADRARRFRITQQDDEAQFERTMRQFLTGPDEAAEATEPPA